MGQFRKKLGTPARKAGVLVWQKYDQSMHVLMNLMGQNKLYKLSRK